MFTLKLQASADIEPRIGFRPHDVLVWLADVTAVSILWAGPLEDFYEPPTSDIQGMVDLYRPEHYVAGGTTDATLLAVFFGDSHRYLLVDRAWLLGPNGQTIERIAP